VDAGRLQQIEENLARTGRRARLALLDATTLGTAVESSFDRILVDAPCSSTGVIRRHPDVKLLRRPGDIAAFAARQLEILRGAFRVLTPGGRLLYCTCSVLPQENEEVIGRFLSEEPAAAAVGLPRPDDLAPGALARGVGVQLLPGTEAGTDGFYYACIEKTTAGQG
jgi:16S rRNA (cytosine967-C5)-methyltransferase